MYNFSICFLPEITSKEERQKNLIRGLITIGSFQEQFLSSLSFWAIEEYKSQWKDAAGHLLSGHEKSCLVTSMLNPLETAYIIIWPLYRRKDIVYVHNNMFFLDSLTEPFDLTKLYSYVPERETVSEEGEPISEWSVSITDLNLWLNLN